MSQKKKPDLSNALADTSHSTRYRQESANLQPSGDKNSGNSSTVPPSRQNTRPITGHFPKEVRDQLKILAVQEDTTMHNLIAEALNDLFAKYKKPEIAPTKAGKDLER
ncbi:hypothetical protein FRE64_07690 [Euhalothece natronophila Z-M001]|uniref:Antitoxin-like ribbon-helix-helix domain-containing protein n=1 Tax=Euhalothece natronophila Z-M001 TaxID=522448 RepID=A0A5B8NLB9_9CHRO|nr:ribbon-helix-helix domain-containing protein [Euhalothece natronophila]QDZ39834.1 hypothetical protein FRE64_07690 [Euhalothece natronophila Z-M001]